MSAIDRFSQCIDSGKSLPRSSATVFNEGEEAITELDRYIRAILMIDEQRMSPAEWRAHRVNLAATLGDDFTRRYIGIIP